MTMGYITAFAVQWPGIALLSIHAVIRKSWPVVLLAWMLLFASVFVLVISHGAGIGLAVALSGVSTIAYLWFSPRVLLSNHIGVDRAVHRDSALAGAYVSRVPVWGRLLSALLLYLVASFAVGLVLATRFPLEEADRLMFGGLSVPLFWAIGSLHATADVDFARVLGLPIFISLAFGLIYFLTGPV